MRILLIEDDEVLTDVLVDALQKQRYSVDTVADGRFGLEYAEEGTYDLLLIDVGLPRLDGISLCKELRNCGNATPILLMTAKDVPDEKIRGLDAGADDYLTKPLDIGELQARLRALLRRGEVLPSILLEIGQLRLDPASCEVTYADKPLKLTPKEYSLLELFLRNPTRVFSRGQIIEHLWTFDDPPLEDSVKAHIKGLRRRLKKAGADGWIENVYGLGYKLSPKIDYGVLAAKSQDNLKRVDIQAEKKSDSSSITPAQETRETETATSVEQQFDQAMADLWAQHQETIRDRLIQIQKAEATLQQGNLTIQTRQSAAKAAHKLAGVLGMFGKEAGTQIARTLEDCLLNEKATLAPDSISPLVDRLKGILSLKDPQPTKTIISATVQKSSEKTVILAVDDDPAFLSTLPPMLEPWGLSVTTLSDPKQFWPTLASSQPELLILDIEMPDINGIELCQEIRSETREDDRWQSLPILFLTSRQNAASAVFAAGADDYVVKPVVGPELITRISNRLERARLLKTLSSRDSQTGLANQTQFQQRFQALRTKETPYTFVLVRLENLGQINLDYGHAVGHEVLSVWGNDIRLWQEDVNRSRAWQAIASYWGSGDFVIGFSGTSGQAAKEAIAPLLKTFRQRIFPSSANADCPSLKERFQAQYAVGITSSSKQENTLKALYQGAYAAMDATLE